MENYPCYPFLSGALLYLVFMHVILLKATASETAVPEIQLRPILS